VPDTLTADDLAARFTELTAAIRTHAAAHPGRTPATEDEREHWADACAAWGVEWQRLWDAQRAVVLELERVRAAAA